MGKKEELRAFYAGFCDAIDNYGAVDFSASELQEHGEAAYREWVTRRRPLPKPDEVLFEAD